MQLYLTVVWLFAFPKLMKTDLIPIRHAFYDHNRDWWNPIGPSRLFDHFGRSMANIEREMAEMEAAMGPYWSRYHRPSVPLGASSPGAGAGEVQNLKDKFLVNMDVSQFTPDDLKVKIQDDFLVVEGKQEDKSDEFGFVSRQFNRKYLIPKDVDQSKLKSFFGKDGMLKIEAPKIGQNPTSEREIPIQPSLNDAAAAPDENKQKKKNKKNEKQKPKEEFK